MFDDARDVIEPLRFARPHSNEVFQQRSGVVEPLFPLEALAVACRWLGRKLLIEATKKKLQVRPRLKLGWPMRMSTMTVSRKIY